MRSCCRIGQSFKAKRVVESWRWRGEGFCARSREVNRDAACRAFARHVYDQIAQHI
jgi:hypothetical protein